MDFADAQFSCYNAFEDVSPIPGVDQSARLEDQPVCPQDHWMDFRCNYDNLTPSAAHIPESGFVDFFQPYSIPSYSYDLQNPVPSCEFSSMVIESQMIYSGFPDPTSIDWDFHPLLQNPTQPSALPANLFHYQTTPSQVQQLPLSTGDLLFSPFVGCASMDGVSPVPRDDENRHRTISTRVDDRGKDTTPHGADFAQGARIIWSYMDVHDNGVCVCLWGDTPGGLCGFKSRTNLVKRHIRRVHFKLR